MATTHRTGSEKTTKLARLLREPTLHFFVIAAAVLLGQRLLAGDPRAIEVTPALKGDLLRRYRDQLNRPVSSAEGEAFIAAWKAEEALYREALREGMDRDDVTVRNVLIAKMRERMLLQTRLREPSEAELQQYLERHRDQFEAPLIYEHEYVVFSKQKPGARQEQEKYQRLLMAGATPASLGLPSTAAKVSRERIQQEFGAEVAVQIGRLPAGQWRALETSDRLLLVQLIRIEGGLPEPEVLRARLVAAWKGALAQEAIAQATRAITESYRFEEKNQ
jgi:hypothetical protein